MTYAEMSAELDVVYENINKNGAPGLDGYEKSVILTHAEELFVKQSLSQDESCELFPELIDVHQDSNPLTGIFIPGEVSFTLPSSYLKILNEEIYAMNGVREETFSVIPITHEDFRREKATPYPYPRRRTAWRLPISYSGAPKVDIILRPTCSSPRFYCRYVRKPKPIIVADLQTLSPFAQGIISTYSVSTPGTGYSVGDTLTISGSTATFRVMTVSAGGVLTVSMLTNGYGLTAGPKGTSSGTGVNCQITIAVVNASAIDGFATPMDCELNPGLHRDILKIAATVAERYYMDKYGNNGTAGDK